MGQHVGVMNRFSNAKGFGFVDFEGAPDVPVHDSINKGDGYKIVKQGDTVQFNIIVGRQGSQADKLKVLTA